MAISQKQFVVDTVKKVLGSRYDASVASLTILTSDELETVKAATSMAISSGQVEYSKDASNAKEVRSYARSMVTNHLNKAKELNGGLSKPRPSQSTGGSSERSDETPVEEASTETHKGIDLSPLSDELRAFVQTL